MKGFNNDVRRRAASAKPLAVYCFGLCLLGHVSLARAYDAGTAFNWLTYQVTAPGVSSYTYAGSSRALVAGPVTLATDGTNRALLTMSSTARNPAIVPYTVNVAGRLSPGLAAKYLTRAIPVVGTLATGVAIYDLIKESGYEIAPAPGGGFTVTKPDPESCALGATCTQWIRGTSAPLQGSWSYSLSGACQSLANAAKAAYSGLYTGGYQVVSNSCQLARVGGGFEPFGGATRTVTGTGVVMQSSSMQELEDAIAAKSGWPTSSNYSRAIVQAQNALKEPLPVDGTTLTTSGPTTTQGGTKTVNNPDGTKSVTTTTYGHTYNTNNVTTTTNNVTNNYNASNVITSTTTETATPAPTEETQTDCDKYPDSNACRKDEFDTPTDEVPKKTITVTWAAENLGFGAGKCIDAQSIHTALGTTTLNFTSYCSMIETWVKPLVIAFSLLAAFFIVAPVKTET